MERDRQIDRQRQGETHRETHTHRDREREKDQLTPPLCVALYSGVRLAKEVRLTAQGLSLALTAELVQLAFGGHLGT